MLATDLDTRYLTAQPKLEVRVHDLLHHDLPDHEFDVVFGYPWDGEAPLMRDVMQRYGRSDALLLLYGVDGRIRTYRGGREEITPGIAHD